MSGEQAALLVALSDPLRPVAPALHLTSEERLYLVEAARSHAVLPIVWRKLEPFLSGVEMDVDERITAIKDELLISSGQSLLLHHHGRRITQAFDGAGIRHSVVKGEVFARVLYPSPSDRPFTDIDVLVDPGDIPRANGIVADLGFVAERKALWDNSERNQEYKWTVADNPKLLFEIHGNLVHYPGLRRRRSFGYGDLLSVAGSSKHPAALLMTAVVHATSGHKLHMLRLVVDIVQAARAIPEGDEQLFAVAARRLHLGFDAAVCLDFCAKVYEDRRCRELARWLQDDLPRRLAPWILTSATVVNAPFANNGTSRLRRHALRALQHLAR
ncbi:nucleotidyltransferase family protein [Terrihabitans rhizophilus]|uniref:Nucleotidyltransferase family protein n=1 Tax=Terrihabitans rhizophilus TaxID=3092662 RepID=A0ABU4RTE7_9HYPH|nr:nucleotidyltransferase family protein [Terrihabitans sp. PJ23]MDX6806950.1 nucleotidyltransferase family protein [Terrihabitans sp. PJ23]